MGHAQSYQLPVTSYVDQKNTETVFEQVVGEFGSQILYVMEPLIETGSLYDPVFGTLMILKPLRYTSTPDHGAFTHVSLVDRHCLAFRVSAVNVVVVGAGAE